tara:strand:+ start:701 stop:1765 length:1065 start_codon:yes stop_codon:yes gene_type:complete
MKNLILTVTVFLSGVASGQSSNSFICGSTQTYSLSEYDAQSIIYLSNLSSKHPDPDHFEQCGLPGLDWKVCKSCSSKKSEDMLVNVLDMLSSKEHRDWHYYWHSIRRELSFDLNNLPPSIGRLNELVDSGWIKMKEKKDQYSRQDFAQFIKDHSSGGLLAGEDFLFMHRQMIKMVQVELAARGDSCIAPWYELPNSVLDSEWAVPRAVYLKEKGKDISYEQNELDNILSMSEQLRDVGYLSRTSLNDLGVDIENMIHGKLHILYAAPNGGCLDPRTDNRKQCSDLTHDRSSHVNKYFWKLHGFIDQLIGDWLEVNGYSYIYRDCSESPIPQKCYQWKGTWLGNEPYKNVGAKGS